LDDHFLGCELVDGSEDLGRRRVHRLSAGHDAAHAEIGQDATDPVPRSHGHDPGSHGIGGVVAAHMGDLVEQVGHLDAVGTAGADACLDGGADLVGVDVAVPRAVAAHYHDRVTQLVPAGLEVVEHVVGGVEQEHDLVARPARPPGVLVALVALWRRRARQEAGGSRRLGYRAAVDHVEKNLEQQHQAGTSGIDHPGLGQHGQQFRGAGQRSP